MPTPDDAGAPAVTRIARRRAIPDHEEDYERDVREMFTRMARHEGFRGADLVPPERAGGDYQVIVHFATERQLAEWDASEDRREVFARMREHAYGEPEHRRLDGLEPWFLPANAPAAARPPRSRMAVVTWLGIWPLASFFIWFLTPVWQGMGLPFLLITAINVALIVACMTYVVAPQLTRLLHGFLHPRPRAR